MWSVLYSQFNHSINENNTMGCIIVNHRTMSYIPYKGNPCMVAQEATFMKPVYAEIQWNMSTAVIIEWGKISGCFRQVAIYNCF